LDYLCNALEGEAANVLWDYGEEVTKSLSKLTETLQKRFDEKAFADKHRIKMRNRRRQRDETLQTLRADIRRLAALAFSGIDYQARESMAADYFLDALGDPDFGLKIRELVQEY